ncbi:MAG TPA: hypothetical protein ENI20_08700 [Bacteroides sp.]|nr:hypothetical protein [Bacteroides sp.]
MKYIKYLQFLALALFLLPLSSIAQDCVDYHLVGDCYFDRQRDYKIYSQSKSLSMNPLETIDLNVIFYGQKDYILSFCSHKKMLPIHFVLIDQETNKVLYDNEDDHYIESVGIGFDATKPLTIRINLLARKATEEDIQDYLVCMGLLIQFKNYDKKTVDIRM